MKNILLIPTYTYMSNPIYIALNEILKDQYEFTYFNIKDKTSLASKQKSDEDKKLKNSFENFLEISFEPFKIDLKNKKKEENSCKFILIYKMIKYIKYYIMIRRYIRDIKKIITQNNPDKIIITSDMTLSYRIIRKYFKNIEILILQPCFLDFRERDLPTFSFVQRLANFLLGGILYPSQPYFGLESNHDKLLLFEDKFTGFYKNKRNNIHKIFNPFFTQLNQQIVEKDKIIIKKILYKGRNIDISKPSIIIFVMDYTLSHGIEVQRYIEKAYINIVKTYKDRFDFIIKNHPRAGIKNFDIYFEKYDNVIFLNNQISYEDLLAIGDLNISINSNASLESLVAGMPTVNFLPLDLNKNEHFRLLSYYCDLEAHTYEDLATILNGFLADKDNFRNKVENAKKMLVGTKEDCKESFLKVL